MIKKRRISFTALAVLLANTTALVAFSGVAAARMRSHDMSSLNLHHENRKDHRDRNDRHVARKHTKRKSHAKRSVECIKAPCSIDSGDRHTKLSHKHAHDRNKDKATGTATARGCGKLIVPTTGCATPARDPVGNTKPSLPKEAKQPTTPVRQPVIFHVKKPAPQSAIRPRNAATVAGELPNSPVGNTHTTAGPNPPTAVTVSNGVTTSSNSKWPRRPIRLLRQAGHDHGLQWQGIQEAIRRIGDLVGQCCRRRRRPGRSSRSA